MGGRILWSHVLVAVGLVGMLVGAIDPLEGSFVILPASALTALGAWLGGSRYRMLLGSAFVLIALGVGAMALLSMWGGVGGRSSHSAWWLLVVLPYPVGWILGLVGVVLRVVEAYRGRVRSQTSGAA